MASSGDELLQAEAELWCHAFGYLKSMALQCAIKLGIPNAINRCGGTASLAELQAALPIAPSKWPCLPRLMRFLAVSGIFKEETPSDGEASGLCYRLTTVSRLLIIDNEGSSYPCLFQFMLLIFLPCHFMASQSLADWLQDKDGAEVMETPFTMVQGARTGLYSIMGGDVEYASCFNEAMACDSHFMVDIVMRECANVFLGVTSLVDVGGGDGTMARAITKAFPHIRCSVLKLQHMVEAAPVDGTVEFVVGDMMESIPPADALLLKWILHNWTDEECVRILKRCKEAISTRDPKGKLIIIDVVVGSQSKQMLEAQLVSDLCMMMMTKGEERDTNKWQRIFQDAGFTQYKISPALGFRSLIELYP